MLKAISKISDAEKAAQEIIQTAQQTATSLKADAKKDGKELLSSLKQEALSEYRNKLNAATEKSDAVLNQNKDVFSNEAKELYENAKVRMDDAVNLVMERIVSSV